MQYVQWRKCSANGIDSIPETNGLYVLAIICKDGQSYAVYVGQTNNLRRRIKEHWSPNETNKGLRDAIQKYGGSFQIWYATTNAWLNDGAERYLFDWYGPQFGEKSPDVMGIQISLPSEVRKGTVRFD